VPVFLHQRLKGHDAAAKSDIYNVAEAEDDYFAANGSYANLQVLAAAEPLHLSAGTTVATVYVDPGNGYCLGAFSSGGSPLPPTEAPLATLANNIVYWWDSQAGGLQPGNAPLNASGTGCPTTTTGAALYYATG
jgi:hypothetical protein